MRILVLCSAALFVLAAGSPAWADDTFKAEHGELNSLSTANPGAGVIFDQVTGDSDGFPNGYPLTVTGSAGEASVDSDSLSGDLSTLTLGLSSLDPGDSLDFTVDIDDSNVWAMGVTNPSIGQGLSPDGLLTATCWDGASDQTVSANLVGGADPSCDAYTEVSVWRTALPGFLLLCAIGLGSTALKRRFRRK